MSRRDELAAVLKLKGLHEREINALIGAVRAENLREAIEAARGEYLTDATGDETDEAYNRGVADSIAAIDALINGGAR
jgi:hypothetical protein